MSRINKKSGLTLTPAVFAALHKALLQALREQYQVTPASLVDYQLYGFNYYDEDLPSIKKMILDKTEQWVNGKYLYNKYREWKKGISPIKFTREFVFIYFKTLGYRDLNDFMLHASLTEVEIAAQKGLETTTLQNQEDEYYVGYYIGEEGNIIATQLTLSESTLKAKWSLAYWEKEEAYSEYIYEGIIQYQQNGMSLIFKNENTNLDRTLCISIFCERQVKVKPFLVGGYTGYDRNRQPVMGEVVFQRVASEEVQKEKIGSHVVNPIIAQHLAGRRWITSGKTLQNLTDLSPTSQFAAIIEQFIKSYRGVFMTIENGIFLMDLEIKDTLGNASLKIAGHPIYKGIFKIQASGQLIIGQFTNNATQAPLFMSIEVLPIQENLFTGDLLGVSRFDKSFGGKVYLSTDAAINQKLPSYRGAELTATEIQNLPTEILFNLTQTLENNRIEKQLQQTTLNSQSNYLSHLKGVYQVVFQAKKQKEKTAQLTITENGKSTLSVQHLIYEGNAMMCEGGVLSIYFTNCNGIPHCGQLIARLGRKRIKELKEVQGNFIALNEQFETEINPIVLCPEVQ